MKIGSSLRRNSEAIHFLLIQGRVLFSYRSLSGPAVSRCWSYKDASASHLVVSDPSGLEVPVEELSIKANQLPTHIASTTKPHNVGPSLAVDNPRERRIHEAKPKAFKVPDNLPFGKDTAVEDLPTFAVTEH